MSVENPGGLSPQAEARLASMAAGAGQDLPAPDWSDLAAVATWRRSQHDAWGEGTEPGEIEHRTGRVADCDVLIAGPDDGPVVLYLHSGGWSLGSPGTEAPITARLARQLRIVSLDYRLAPEHPYPAAIEDAVRLYRALVAEHGAVAVAGCSAGGNLAVQVAWRCPDVVPPALLLLCPHLAFGRRTESGARKLRPFEAAYLAGHDPTDPMAAPANAEEDQLALLPPTLVQWTDAEPMAPDIADFAARAGQAGAPVVTQIWQGLWHAWQFHRELPEAWRAVDAATDWLAGTIG